ncbi:MAG: hypothetical protein GWN18_04540 [Thermoplasmata archaeon]|nr:hypothetical protein [Thermoplasmata archaeon]NIS11294.1 hypothetical protein [Thermoplasmata archaeon]NIS19748.1 hypothetical protein [Thermoplasmata archaeon]NIT76307.1 hypothetical protein [Thermoplasmata archaeon]NIU48859.1 hypothetical protein [Thermoplasmata archaeon]
MEDNLDLERIEASAFKAYFEDGMFDIFFGLMFIISGIRNLTDEPIVTLFILAAVLVPVIGKRALTYPRLGQVKFGERRVRGQLRLMVAIVVAVLITAAIVAITQFSDVLEGRLLADLAFGAMFIVVTAMMGRYFEYPFLVVHGIIFAIIAVVYGQYGDEAGVIASLVGGSISVTIGLVNMATFLRRYPRLTMEA